MTRTASSQSPKYKLVFLLIGVLFPSHYSTISNAFVCVNTSTSGIGINQIKSHTENTDVHIGARSRPLVLFAFPDRKHNNSKNHHDDKSSSSKRRPSIHSKLTKRKFREIDDEDDINDNSTTKQSNQEQSERKLRPPILPRRPSINTKRNNNSHSKNSNYNRQQRARHQKPQQNQYIRSKNHVQRNSANKPRSNSQNYERKFNNNINSQPRTIIGTFTRHLIAPSLVASSETIEVLTSVAERRRRSKSIQSNTHGNSTSSTGTSATTTISPDINDFIVSPSVLQQHEEGCQPYICGPLAVTYTNDDHTVKRWLNDNVYRNKNEDEFSYVGFDVEAVPNVPWRKPKASQIGPATIQISTPYSSLVIHLTSRHLSSEITPTKSCPCCSKPLQQLLSDPTVLKVGAGIEEDMLELFRYNPSLIAKSRFDIGGIGSSSKSQRLGLQRLVRAITGVELQKSKKISMSNWSKVPLEEKQLCYASRDAWAGAAIMENLSSMYPEHMSADTIGKMVVEHERGIEEVSERAYIRKKAKMELRALGKGTMTDEKHRLMDIISEMAPDSVFLFESELFGLDFAFDNPDARQ